MKRKLLSTSVILLFASLYSLNAQTTLCGQLFTDSQGPNANYINNEDYTVTLYPSNPGEVVTVSFVSFDTEVNYDGLYIFNGDSTSAPQIASNNPAGNVPGGLAGAFWGTTNPGSFTSTHPSGSLTFRFRSDTSVNKAGWVANVTCGSLSSCIVPNNLFATNFTGTTATIGWVESGNATNWEVLIVPAGTPAPTQATSGTPTTNNPYIASGLTPGVVYTAYVRAVCSDIPGDVSNWSYGLTITTTTTSCTPPTNLTVSNITNSGATLNWAFNSAPQWEVVVLPSNGGLPTPNTTGTVVTTNSFTVTGLNPNTAYNFFIRSLCNPAVSIWSNGTYFLTAPAVIIPPACGEAFFDNGGPNANYVNNSDNTYVICPTNPGEVVTVDFNSFDVEPTWDGLYVYDGNSISAPQISSGNSGNSIPGGVPGAFWGTTAPGPFTSTSPDGCLTFRFRSDNVVVKAGWSASVTCQPAATCPKPTSVTTSNVTTNSVVVGWNSNSTATSWEVLALPCGTAPTATSTGIVVSVNPYTLTDLTASTCYNIYVRGICSDTDTSNWSTAATVTTLATCPNPTQISASNVTQNSATINWFETGSATSWEVIALPCGVPAPLAIATGMIATDVNPFVLTNLSPYTCYDVYVRSICSETDMSVWSGPLTINTQPLPPVCGGNFFDPAGPNANYANNTDSTVTICPNNPGELVTVTFTSFALENNWDGLYVYDGNSIAAPQIASSNPAGQVPGGLPGAFWGTIIPGPFTSSSPDGCLTFRFVSDSSVVMAGWSANVTCTPDADKIILVAFVDSNNNGTKEADETTFSHGSFMYDMNDAGTPMMAYSPTGQFALYDTNPDNSYDFTYQLESSYAPYYSAGTTSYSNVSIPVGSIYQILYFPITVTQGYNDVTVSIVAQNPPPRPGFTYTNKIVYKNEGLTPTSGTLTFTKGSVVTITNVTQAGIVTTTDGFTYNFTNLAPNETRYITVTMLVPTIPTVSLGDVITNTATVSAPADDIDLDNNAFSISQIIVGSYDPNDKMESHGGRILITEYNPSDYLYYTIRFQNEGTASAEFVILEDVLDAQIDESSIQMVSASHDYVMTRMNNEITWDFRNINLVPKTVNEEASMGYVMFRVRLQPGIEVGDVVPNTADIFFDFNPAITTNTFNTEIVAPLGNPTFETGNFEMIPNPADSMVQISLESASEQINNIAIYDVMGKQIRNINNSLSNEVAVDVSELSNGIYFVEITTDSNVKTTKKLVVK
ncbi:DUF7619 domain-containing protein [Flavobacterium sp.]|uniref:DUF7619 domain-containing protein n=1 Tax=Flavobacterium sp. TaxID=239 RepID=UPI002B4B30F6|nr:fibronectin type III domain-containing protein [Flavobacterium sp.]HLP65316.1 fibronectin type III domain-containing protein [Flavobacterium sp.]